MIGNLIAAIKANRTEQVKAILRDIRFITEEDTRELYKNFNGITEDVRQALKEWMQSEIFMDSEQNNVEIRMPFEMFIWSKEYKQHMLIPRITTPNAYIFITDNDTNQVFEVPAVTYFLIKKIFNHTYSHILHDEFDPLILCDLDVEGVHKALSKYLGSNADIESLIDIESLRTISKVLTQTPEVIKYINFASIQTQSYSLPAEHKMDKLTNLITNIHFQKIVTIIENRVFTDFSPALDALAETPEIFVLFNLGPLFPKDFFLATEMVRYIHEKGGSIYGHIPSREGDLHVISPILAYTVAHEMGELSALLMAQHDPLEEEIGHEHPNHIIYTINLEHRIETPILIYLMRSDFEAAKLYMGHHPNHKSAIEFDDIHNTQISACELSIKHGGYTLEQALEAFADSMGFLSGHILSRVIKSRKDVKIASKKIDLNHQLHAVYNYEDDLEIKIPLITHFMEDKRWDIVAKMVEVGVDLFAQKTISKCGEEDKKELLSSGPTVCEMLLAQGYKKEYLIQNINLSCTAVWNIITSYNKNPELTLDIIKSCPIPVNMLRAIEGETFFANILHHAIHAKANDLFDVIYDQENVDNDVLNNSIAPLLLYALRQHNQHVIDKLLANKNVNLFLEEFIVTEIGACHQEESTIHALLKWGYRANKDNKTVNLLLEELVVKDGGECYNGENTIHALLKYGYTPAKIAKIIYDTGRNIEYNASSEDDVIAELVAEYRTYEQEQLALTGELHHSDT